MNSVYDSKIFKNSKYKYNILKNNTQERLLLGDDGYTIVPRIMILLRNSATQDQQNSTNIFCQKHVIIDRFGQLEARFSVFLIRCQLEKKIHQQSFPAFYFIISLNV